MLTTLRVRDIAIIEDLVVEFGPGLNVLTGETGAGKSIVVDALALAAGERADARLVRSGASRAVVEAVFAPPPGGDWSRLLEERGIDGSTSEIVVRREVAAEGAGRIYLNGSPCALAVVREIGELLVELHGQHEHQSLLSVERHQELLDRFGEHEEILARVGAAHERVLEIVRNKARLEERKAERGGRAEDLARRIREIDAVSPRAGEYESLETERRILKNAGRLAELLDEAIAALYDGEPAAAALGAAAARRVAELAQIDPALEDLARRLETARLELEDAGATLRDYKDRTDFDPDRLESATSRLAALDRLRLHYGPDEEAVLRSREEAARELAQIENVDAEMERLAAELAGAEEEYRRAASALSKARGAAGRRLKPRIEMQLASLALPKARLDVAFTPARGRSLELRAAGDTVLHPRGSERVEFLLAANPGEPARPLSKVASGGELSRVMLALHAVLDGAGQGRVLVFDEVDAGIGGAVADAVGARLSQLALRNQVLCVTHLPQVAAHADRHYHVHKRTVSGRTRAEVRALSGDERVDELARMLGGKGITDASRRNARVLLREASGSRDAQLGGPA